MKKTAVILLVSGLILCGCPLPREDEPPASGAALWAMTVLSTEASASNFHGSATDADGNVYAAGYMNGNKTYTFGTTVTAVGPYADGDNLVLVKYNAAGVAQWARTLTAGNDYTIFNSVAVAVDGNVYVAGTVTGTGQYTFAPGVSVTGTFSGYNCVVVKYNTAGDALWARTVSAGASYSFFSSVTAGADGNIYAAGYIQNTGTYNFGNAVTIAGSSSVQNAVVVKYDSNGTAQWARSVITGDDYSYFASIAAGANGDVYAAGIIRGTGTYTFRTGVTATGTNDAGSGTGYNAVVVKYDTATGNALWAKTVTTGAEDSSFYGVTVDDGGSVAVAGIVKGTGTFTFDTGVTAAGSASDNNAVLVKYSASGTAQWARTVSTGTAVSSFVDVAADTNGNLFAAGRITGTGLYTFGPNATAAGVDALDNVVLVKYDSSGTAQWARTVSTAPSFSSFSDVAADADGNVYAVGIVMGMGTYTFGTNVTGGGILSDYSHGVLVKYSN